MEQLNEKPMKVLIAVDVQNCFMYTTEDQKNNAGLNLGEDTLSYEVANEISDLILNKEHPNYVVFTRDFHPINHISFGGDEGRQIDYISTWPRHCRNKNSICTSRVETTESGTTKSKNNESFPQSGTTESKNNESFPQSGTTESKNNESFPQSGTTLTEVVNNLDKTVNTDSEKYLKNLKNLKTFINERNIGDTPVLGTDLSYFFYGTGLGHTILTLNQNNKRGENKIGMRRTMIENGEEPIKIDSKTKETSRDLHFGETISIKAVSQAIVLTKGERCNDESYSAFNYHITYDYDYDQNKTDHSPSKPFRKELPINKDNSTGLWEWIIKKAKVDKYKNIEITVCGLVTNVCVMHTVIQGIAMWNQVYAKENPNFKVSFTLSLKGSRFAPNPPPGKSNYYKDEPDKFEFESSHIIGWMKIMSGSNENTKFQGKEEKVLPINSVLNFNVLYYNNEKHPVEISYYAEDEPFPEKELLGQEDLTEGGRKRRRSMKNKQRGKQRTMKKRFKRTKRKHSMGCPCKKCRRKIFKSKKM